MPECKTCGGRGKWDIEGCLGCQAPTWASRIVFYARTFQEIGVFPDGGPLLHQSAWFVNACEIVWLLYGKYISDGR